MPDAYRQLLDAAIQHLQGLKEHGVQFVPVSSGTLAALSQPQRVAPAHIPPAPRAPGTDCAQIDGGEAGA